MNPDHALIAQQNDAFRRHGPGSDRPGQMVMTAGIAALPFPVQFQVQMAVRSFEAFTPDNDPHQEHDFGAVDVPGAGRIFWKIDYYDPALTQGSEDPADPLQTLRVLTIMLANEY